jgi:L-methionine (R)-S-oxide reductase
VPLMAGSTLLGVLDIDSPRVARFDDEDARGLETLAAVFLAVSAAAVPARPE